MSGFPPSGEGHLLGHTEDYYGNRDSGHPSGDIDSKRGVGGSYGDVKTAHAGLEALDIAASSAAWAEGLSAAMTAAIANQVPKEQTLAGDSRPIEGDSKQYAQAPKGSAYDAKGKAPAVGPKAVHTSLASPSSSSPLAVDAAVTSSHADEAPPPSSSQPQISQGRDPHEASAKLYRDLGDLRTRLEARRREATAPTDTATASSCPAQNDSTATQEAAAESKQPRRGGGLDRYSAVDLETMDVDELEEAVKQLALQADEQYALELYDEECKGGEKR